MKERSAHCLLHLLSSSLFLSPERKPSSVGAAEGLLISWQANKKLSPNNHSLFSTLLIWVHQKFQGDTISNVPPPHVFVVGRFFFEKILILTKFVDFFFLFLLVRMSESDRRVPLICRLKIVNADGVAEKKLTAIWCQFPPWIIYLQCFVSF